MERQGRAAYAAEELLKKVPEFSSATIRSGSNAPLSFRPEPLAALWKQKGRTLPSAMPVGALPGDAYL